jgi:hypothetical protein
VSDSDPRTPEQRAAFRAFVRDHHPDRGGDPAVFTTGIDRFRSAPADDDPAPVQPTRAAGPLPFPVRVGVAAIRTWRRRHEQ